MESSLRPFFKVLGKKLNVTLWKPDDSFLKTHAPFGLLFISEDHESSEPDELFRGSLLELAKDTGCSRIVQEVDGGLVIAILSQYRYWTPSRARLLGAEIVRQHMRMFEA